MRAHESTRNRQWNGGPPMSVFPANQMPIPNQRSLPPRRKEYKDYNFTRKSPEIDSRLEEKEDNTITYIAAGTAPLPKTSTTSPKSASPASSHSHTHTNYAGFLSNYPNTSYIPKFERNLFGSDTISPKGFSNVAALEGRTPIRQNNKRASAGGKYEISPNYRRYRSHHNDESELVFPIGRSPDSWNRRSDFNYNERRGGNDRFPHVERRWERSRSGDISRVYPQLSHSHLGSLPNIPRLPYDEGLFSELQRKQKNTDLKSDEGMDRLIHMMNQQQLLSQQGLSDASQEPSNVASWPVPGNVADSKSEPTMLHPILPSSSSPLKQNYSDVVARNSRSSVSDSHVPKESPSAPLYSQKAALSIQSPNCKVHLQPRTDRLKSLTPLKQGAPTKGDRRTLAEIAAAGSSLDLQKKAVEHKDSDLSSNSNMPPSPPPSDPIDQSGQFEISKMDVLSEQIWHFHNKITQKESTLTRKLSLRDMLYYAISPVFPMCGLYVVGSSLNGFGNDTSDMDLCLMITNKDLDQKTDAVVVLNMILSALQRMEWVTHQKLILAKVPILRIKFAAPFNDITVDLNANNSVAIRNTHLLCYYSSFDWRVRPLVSIVKEWAKRKGINDANRSSFTSYSLVLMVIHYLQCGTNPAILPSLQMKYSKRFNNRADVRMLNVTQPLSNESHWDYQSKTTLGELLIGFFKYFSSEFDYNSQAISIKEGKIISRKQVTHTKPTSDYINAVTWRSQWRCICIQEPFTFNNTAHSIYDEMVFNAIKKAFDEAHNDLEKNRDIDCLVLNCKPITVAPPIHGATAYIYDGVSREATLESGMIHGGASPSRLNLSNCGSNNSINSGEVGNVSAVDSVGGDENEKENFERQSSAESLRSSGNIRQYAGRSFIKGKNKQQTRGPQSHQQRGSS